MTFANLPLARRDPPDPLLVCGPFL
jgi:hypothetical protein